MSLTAIKSLGSLAGGLQNATRLQHTGGTLYASRHHTHPLMVDRTAEKGAQPSTLPKGFPRKPGSSAEAPGTPPSPGRRRRQLHASPRRRRRRRCPSPAARRPLGAKFRGPRQMVSRCKLRCFRGLSPRAPTPARARPPLTHAHARTHALAGEGRAASTACSCHTINNNRFLRSGLVPEPRQRRRPRGAPNPRRPLAGLKPGWPRS